MKVVSGELKKVFGLILSEGEGIFFVIFVVGFFGFVFGFVVF